jgi:hypothetical protein
VPPTRGQASGGKKITVDLVCIHNTGGTEKAKGEGASKYGDPETRMIVWIPNACHDVVTDQTALEGLREGCTRVVLDEQLWREKQAEWKPAEDRDSYAMDEALSKANHEDVPF